MSESSKPHSWSPTWVMGAIKLGILVDDMLQGSFVIFSSMESTRLAPRNNIGQRKRWTFYRMTLSPIEEAHVAIYTTIWRISIIRFCCYFRGCKDLLSISALAHTLAMRFCIQKLKTKGKSSFKRKSCTFSQLQHSSLLTFGDPV